MAIFRYIGEERETTAFGITFPQRQQIEVHDERAVNKLRANQHFEEVGNEESAEEDNEPEPSPQRAGRRRK